MPRVSVIIPTYNRADLLGNAIASVLAQNYSDFEVIVADDGSTDHSAEVIAGFDARVCHLRLPHRGQPAAPRNSALAVATGEYIAFLDSDDLFLPNKLALQVPVLDANPRVGLVYSDGYFFSENPDQPASHALAGLSTPSGAVFGELLRRNFLFMPLVLIRRTLLEKSGAFSEQPDLLVAEDYDLWLRLSLQTDFQYVPGDVAAIRLHPNNISGNMWRMRKSILGILQRFDREHATAMATHAVARHEAYAISHGALARIAWLERRTGLLFPHLWHALWHTVQLPGFGTSALLAWWKRRKMRTSRE